MNCDLFAKAEETQMKANCHRASVLDLYGAALGCAPQFLVHQRTHTDLHRQFLPQGKQERVHIDIGIFLDAVGFGVVPGVQKSPPFG